MLKALSPSFSVLGVANKQFNHHQSVSQSKSHSTNHPCIVDPPSMSSSSLLPCLDSHPSIIHLSSQSSIHACASFAPSSFVHQGQAGSRRVSLSEGWEFWVVYIFVQLYSYVHICCTDHHHNAHKVKHTPKHNPTSPHCRGHTLTHKHIPHWVLEQQR